MTQPVIFTVPAGLQRAQTIIDLNERIKATGKNIQIHAYDTVQGLAWNGGRLMFNREIVRDEKSAWYGLLTQDQAEEAVARAKSLNRAGIPFNLVFNNTLESLDVEDEVGNYLLQQLHDEMNGVTISSRALKQHISANYPKYATTASICFCVDGTEQAQRLCNEYDKVVLLPKFAYATELMEGLPIDKLVFIVNDQCYLLCTRKEHYNAISRCYLGGNNTYQEQQRNAACGDCFMKNPGYRARVNKATDPQFGYRLEKAMGTQRKDDGLRPGDLEYDFNITPTTRKDLIRRGICNFKLQGRDYSDAAYQASVVDFLEKMVNEEL
jgi:hypothetical protein